MGNYFSKLFYYFLLFSADDAGLVYYSMFFATDRPLEEFYCICIQLLSKTWREMRATIADFPKVRN